MAAAELRKIQNLITIFIKLNSENYLKLFKAAYFKKFETKSIGHGLSPLNKNGEGRG